MRLPHLPARSSNLRRPLDTSTDRPKRVEFIPKGLSLCFSLLWSPSRLSFAHGDIAKRVAFKNKATENVGPAL